MRRCVGPTRAKLADSLQVMRDGLWQSAIELCELTGMSPLSIAARIRDLRKNEYEAYTVLKKKATHRAVLYWLLV